MTSKRERQESSQEYMEVVTAMARAKATVKVKVKVMVMVAYELSDSSVYQGPLQNSGTVVDAENEIHSRGRRSDSANWLTKTTAEENVSGVAQPLWY